MKKAIIWMLMLVLTISLLGCAKENPPQPTQPAPTQGTKPRLTTLSDEELLQFMEDSGVNPPAILSEGETTLIDCVREAVTQAEADPTVDFSKTVKDLEISGFMNHLRDAVNVYYGRK